MYGDAPLECGQIRQALTEVWGLGTSEIEYLPVGYGSYHWRAAIAGGLELFVTADGVDSPFPVQAAYELAWRLGDDGLGFVRAPVLHRDGGVVHREGEWLLSVWPWLDGRTKDGAGEHDRGDLEATLRCVRQLHEYVPTAVPDIELVEDWSLDGRADLLNLMTRREWGTGPYADEVRRRLSDHSGRVHGWLARYDELVAEISAAGVECVVTHGEPHAGNVVHTETGPMLIDWDTVRLAPRERDLWSLTDEDGFAAGYGEAELSPAALEVYQLQWTLTEIADFAVTLADAVEGNPDLEIAMRELRRYLPG